MSKFSCARCGQYDGAHAAGCLFVSAADKAAGTTKSAAYEAAKVGKKVPRVTVNGRVLTGSEVMTMHTALCVFYAEFENGLPGADEQAQTITRGYKQCLQSILRLMDS